MAHIRAFELSHQSAKILISTRKCAPLAEYRDSKMQIKLINLTLKKADNAKKENKSCIK